MSFRKTCLAFFGAFAALQGVYAGLDLSSNSTVTVYWGQNSFRGTGDLAQQRLGYYCDDPNIDVIILAFLMTINGPGGAPEIDFATSSEKCETFAGTNLKSCPEIGTDITTCQSKNKTILLSIGGATYSEGGFASEMAAEAGADLLWATFGPPQTPTTETDRTSGQGRGHAVQAHRPFGTAILDGFDFDFEAAVTNMAPFAKRLRSLADADTAESQRTYFLTAAPQCPFPDAADREILNTDASATIDAVWVQFYNNYCGVNAYSSGSVGNFNFETWDTWALTESKNPNVKVYLGVPANTGAAGTGYLPISSLSPVIQYSKQFESFGGVMMWDVSQAYGNQGFLDGVRGALRGTGNVQGPNKGEEDIPVLEVEDSSASGSASEEETVSTSAPESEPQQPWLFPFVTQQEATTSAEDASADADASPVAPQSGELQDNQDESAEQSADRPLLPSFMEPDADLPWIEI
ncbi:glycoside hydrolase superfamily [Aspergillus carlsbadensis]|nr:glycoside hydrolase superfamily [Aspergillus carlsbadensis]